MRIVCVIVSRSAVLVPTAVIRKKKVSSAGANKRQRASMINLQSFRFRINSLYARRVDSSALVFSLSSDRHSEIGFLNISRIINS
jgi:hypothetical protein